MSAIAIRQRVKDDFCPRLDRALRANDDVALYGIVPEIQGFFNNGSHVDESLRSFLEDACGDTQIKRFQSQISEATQRMEMTAQRYFIERMAAFDDDGKIGFIRSLGTPGTDFGCPMLNFERIPELQAEKKAAEITADSKVLILGTGSISVSGLYFASHGANVTLLDRDPRAIDNFRAVYDLLPREIQNRISFETTCDARDYSYDISTTHICLAALLEPKEPIVAKIRERFTDSGAPVTLLLRTPREDLMQLFYYNVDKSCLNGMRIVDKVDIGHAEQPANTFILKL